jgi:hypothetical protein
MSIPAATHPCWQRLAQGALAKLQSKHLGTQLMTKRLMLSSDSAEAKATEIRAYFVQWERILKDEIPQLLTL